MLFLSLFVLSLSSIARIQFSINFAGIKSCLLLVFVIGYNFYGDLGLNQSDKSEDINTMSRKKISKVFLEITTPFIVMIITTIYGMLDEITMGTVV